MKPNYCKRLLALAKRLDTVPEEKFDYSCWISSKTNPDLIHGCKTTACALGWACTMPQFQKLGLVFERRTRDECYSPTLSSGAVGSCAAQELFGLDEDEVMYLFYPYCSRPDEYDELLPKMGPRSEATPKQVAEHFRAFAKVRWPSEFSPKEIKKILKKAKV